ncbi:MAG: hypothetical protein J6Q38_05125 [Clostridia bacterium]|nr:hypothetical protein [Clostridia bacterium]
MKNLILKTVTLCLTFTFLLSLTACTYRKDGSVVQDVTFTMSYENSESENVSIEVTASFYKTFAPKTCDHLLAQIKKGYYENTAVVSNKTGEYLILGSFKYSDEEYKELIYTGSTVEGEFSKGGWKSRLKAEAGSLVLLREPDTGKGSPKYDTGKVSIALLLSETDVISNEYFSVFGKINTNVLDDFDDLREDLFYDDDGDIKIRYIGDRNENDVLTVTDGKYDGGMEFYINLNDEEIKGLDKKVIEAEISEGVENELYKKLSTANEFDLFALPTKPITVSGFKLK